MASEKWGMRVAGTIIIGILLFGSKLFPPRNEAPPPPPTQVLGQVEPLDSVGKAEHVASTPIAAAPAAPPPGFGEAQAGEVPRSRAKYDFSKDLDNREAEIKRLKPNQRDSKTIFRVQVGAYKDKQSAFREKDTLRKINGDYVIDIVFNDETGMYLVQVAADGRKDAQKISNALKKKKFAPYIKEY